MESIWDERAFALPVGTRPSSVGLPCAAGHQCPQQQEVEIASSTLFSAAVIGFVAFQMTQRVGRRRPHLARRATLKPDGCNDKSMKETHLDQAAQYRRNLLTAAATATVAPEVKAVAQVSRESFKLPEFGVGAWAWGDRLFWGYDEKQDSDIQAGFEACVRGGVKLFDTAELYGPGRSEELLGKFIKKSGRTDLKVATKFAAFPWKLDRSDVVKACKASLERLGMDTIDLYQIHFPAVWKNEVFWDGLGDCYEQGLVKAVGVSNYGSAATRAISKTLAARGIPLTSNQIQYSLVYRAPELNGMKATCDELGVKVLAYSPLGLGTLTGKFSLDKLPSGPRASIAQKLLNDAYWPGMLATMKEVATAHGSDTSLSQVALAWCLGKGTVPIPGVRNARQAEDNIKAMSLKLSSGEITALDDAASRLTPYIAPSESPFAALKESLDTKQLMYEA